MLADDGFYFLQNYAWSDVQSEKDLDVSVAVAKMVLEAADHDPEIMIRTITEPGEVRKKRVSRFKDLTVVPRNHLGILWAFGPGILYCWQHCRTHRTRGP